MGASAAGQMFINHTKMFIKYGAAYTSIIMISYRHSAAVAAVYTKPTPSRRICGCPHLDNPKNLGRARIISLAGPMW